jgi:hypothetical protein
MSDESASLDPIVGAPPGDEHPIPRETIRDGEAEHVAVSGGYPIESGPAAAPSWYKEANMLKRVLTVVIVCLAIYMIYWGYQHYRAQRETANGEIYGEDTVPQPSRSDIPGTVNGSRVDTSVRPGGNLAVPTGDSIPPNPANGKIFAGTGKFQIYRQGNLTWRVNTETGQSCILFATEEEWRKAIVYSHGCNAS